MEPTYHHEIKLVKASEIRLNDYNPNIVSPELLSQLEKRIREEGFLQPVLLRLIKPQNGKKYEMIDGEHRYEVAVNRLGYEELPAIVVDKNLPDAMVATINMNKLRGEFDTLKLAEVIHELHKTYTIDELEDKLGYNKDELEGLEGLFEFDFGQHDEEDVSLGEGDSVPEYRFEVVLTVKQFKVVEAALSNTGKEDSAEGLTEVCLKYMTKYGKEKRS